VSGRATPICIVSAGVVSSVGGSAASTCAAVRASLDNFCETHFVDETGQPLLGAPVDGTLLGLADEADGMRQGGVKRLAAMFVRAAGECVRGAGGIDAARTALLVLGPEASRPGVTLKALMRCFAACQKAVGAPFHAASGITRIGSPGLADALQYAAELLAEPQGDAGPSQAEGSGVDAVLVAGVDSLLNTKDIHALLAQGRLLTGDNADGFIPGEAAACLLVTRLDTVAPCARDTQGREFARAPVLRVAGVGLGDEPDCLSAGKPSRGQGLARAIAHALSGAGLPAQAMHARLADVTAESAFFEEAGYAWTRVLRAPAAPGQAGPLESTRFDTPVTRVGHVGSAMGPLLAALALDAARKAWAAGPRTLLHLSSHDTARGAVVLEAA
jgi:3-oxoacyl-[acyl-carrier-protein] synthase-1